MLMWIFMGSAVVSILLAMLIVSISTHNQRGILLPTTPDTTGPVWIPTLKFHSAISIKTLRRMGV